MAATHTRSRLWCAIHQLTTTWRAAPTIKRMAASLPRNVLRPGTPAHNPLAHLLQELTASASGMLHPLALGTRVPFILSQDLIHPQTTVDAAALREWVESAAAVESAHRATLAWYRSRIAGYPMIRAPQLAPNSPFTTLEYTSEFIWTPEERGQGLQFAVAPRGLTELLGIKDGWLVGQASRNVLRELEQTNEWICFSTTSDALDSAAKSALRAARLELKELLGEGRVDDHEPRFAWPRIEYRTRTLAAVVDALDGPARDYAEAFAALQEMLQLCVTDVFGELVAYGEPKSVRATFLEYPDPDPSIVEFTTPDTDPLSLGTGQLLWLEDSPVRDIVRVEAMTMSFDNVDGATLSFRARVLDGTREAWERKCGSTPRHARPGSALFRPVVATEP